MCIVLIVLMLVKGAEHVCARSSSGSLESFTNNSSFLKLQAQNTVCARSSSGSLESFTNDCVAKCKGALYLFNGDCSLLGGSIGSISSDPDEDPRPSNGCICVAVSTAETAP